MLQRVFTHKAYMYTYINIKYSEFTILYTRVHNISTLFV